MQSPPFPVTSSLLGPNILLNTMFSNTLTLLSSRNVSDQVSHPYKTIGKIIVLYISIFYPSIRDKSNCEVDRSKCVYEYLSACRDGTECSETSAYKIQTPGKYPEESIQHSEHGESLKSIVFVNVSLRENRALYN